MVIVVDFSRQSVCRYLPGKQLQDTNRRGRQARSGSDSVSTVSCVAESSIGIVLDECVSTYSSVRKGRQTLHSGIAAAIKRRRGASVDAKTTAVVDQEASEQAVREARGAEGCKWCMCEEGCKEKLKRQN